MGHAIWRWLEFHDIDAECLFSGQGLSRQDLQPHSARVPGRKWDAIVTSALEQLDNSCVGLSAARCWHPSDLGALGYAWLASSTLRTAFQRMARYMKVVGERGTLSLQDTANGFRASFHLARCEPTPREIIVDFAMSVMFDMARVNFGKSLLASEVTLQRERPGCAARYADFFGCEATFSAMQDSFTLTAADTDSPLPSANRQLAGVHDQILVQQLAALNRDDIVTRTRAIILDNLTTGNISTEKIARELHMSSRTLTRRLESRGHAVAETDRRNPSRTGRTLFRRSGKHALRDCVPARFRPTEFTDTRGKPLVRRITKYLPPDTGRPADRLGDSHSDNRPTFSI